MERQLKFSAILLTCFFLFFKTAFGAVLLNEIMYDFPGSEGSGEHDWIEVKNDGSTSIDLSTYKFFEANTNHGLKFDRGNQILPPGGLAVIANATSTFLADNPGFSGTLFDSSFSLNSTVAGEPLVIRNADLVNEETPVVYSSDWGAKDDGNSLQKIDGVWKPATPTPGLPNSSVQNNNSADSSALSPTATSSDNTVSQSQANSSQNQSQNANSSGSNWPVEPQIFARIKGQSSAVAGADVLFSGEAFGIEKKPIENARYLWNFGDGETKEGQTVMHDFSYPGNYVVVLHVSSGTFVGSSRLIVKALVPDIKISKIESGIGGMAEIENRMGEELDLSWWRIESSGNFFTIPEGTVILPKSKLVFSAQITKLNMNFSDTRLLFPNGMVAVDYARQNVALDSPTISAPNISKAVAPNVPNQTARAPQSGSLNSQKVAVATVAYDSDAGADTQIASSGGVGAFNSGNLAAAGTAAAGSAGSNFGLLKWLLAVFGLIVIASVGFFYLGKKPETATAGEDYGDIKIIED